MKIKMHRIQTVIDSSEGDTCFKIDQLKAVSYASQDIQSFFLGPVLYVYMFSKIRGIKQKHKDQVGTCFVRSNLLSLFVPKALQSRI